MKIQILLIPLLAISSAYGATRSIDLEIPVGSIEGYKAYLEATRLVSADADSNGSVSDSEALDWLVGQINDELQDIDTIVMSRWVAENRPGLLTVDLTTAEQTVRDAEEALEVERDKVRTAVKDATR